MNRCPSPEDVEEFVYPNYRNYPCFEGYPCYGMYTSYPMTSYPIEGDPTYRYRDSIRYPEFYKYRPRRYYSRRTTFMPSSYYDFYY